MFANMEMVLDVYKRPFDPLYPIVCMDESSKQLIAETRIPIPATPGHPTMQDYEYRRCGVCNIFIACEPLAGKRMVKITERRTKKDWACFLEEIADQYEGANKITLVMDNLNTHVPGSFYETFLVLLLSVVTGDSPPLMQKSIDYATSCHDKQSR